MDNVEKIRKEDYRDRQERYAAREKYRKDTEIYGEIFFNWEEIMRERNLQLQKRELERQERLEKAKTLKGTWELMKVCKEFLEEWEQDWVEGTEKERERQEKKQREQDKNERLQKIETKRKNKGIR